MMKLVIINNWGERERGWEGGEFVDTKLLNLIIIVHYGASRWNPKIGRIFLNENC
jgi:hypothetical protein